MAEKSASTKPATRKRATSSGPSKENSALDNPLYVPRLDLVALPESTLDGAGPDYSDLLESICGVTDDSQPVEQYDGSLGVTTAFVNAHQKPVAQVQWNDNLASVFTNPGDVNGVRWGSGTMIGPDLFLTCGHLFDSDPNGWTIPRQNGTANAISPQDAARNMHLNFEFQVDASGTLRAEQRFPITQLIEYRLGGLDMALCRIGGNPGNIYGWTEFATTNAAVGDMLAIIGHPAGQPKRIEAGPLTQLTGSTVRYDDVDTLGGNSGSGILQSPSGRVIGVHTNGGCNSAGTGSNSGVAIAAIIAASPTLQATTPSSRTARGDDLIGTPLAADVQGTFRAADTGVAQDLLTTPLSADIQGTLRAADSGTIQDQLGTPLSLDIQGTALQADTGLRDQIGTLGAADLGTIGAGDDPNNTLAEQIFDPSRVGVDPVVFRGLGGQRPFVQAGPFTPVDGGGEVTTADAVLAELESAITAQAAVLASLQAIYAAVAGASQAAVEG